MLNKILFNICFKKVDGFYEPRPNTALAYKLASWLYTKGIR